LAGALIASSGIAAAQAPGGGGGGRGGRGLASADANSDGIVTKAEFTTQVEGRFAQLDANKDGTVTPEERQAAFQAGGGGGGGGGPGGGGGGFGGGGGGGGGGPGGPPPGPMTKAQYLEQQMGRFDRADANKDGKVDQAELAAAPGPGGGQRPPGT
jgi:hypothetical protein